MIKTILRLDTFHNFYIRCAQTGNETIADQCRALYSPIRFDSIELVVPPNYIESIKLTFKAIEDFQTHEYDIIMRHLKTIYGTNSGAGTGYYSSCCFINDNISCDFPSVWVEQATHFMTMARLSQSVQKNIVTHPWSDAFKHIISLQKTFAHDLATSLIKQFVSQSRNAYASCMIYEIEFVGPQSIRDIIDSALNILKESFSVYYKLVLDNIKGIYAYPQNFVYGFYEKYVFVPDDNREGYSFRIGDMIRYLVYQAEMSRLYFTDILKWDWNKSHELSSVKADQAAKEFAAYELQ